MRKLLLITGLLINLCCSKEKENRIETIVEEPQLYNEELRLYTNVLDELVRYNFYYRYLGEEEEDSLYKQYGGYEDLDTVGYKNGIEKLRKKVESDTSKQRFICLRNELSMIEIIIGYTPDSSTVWLKSFTNKLSDDFGGISDSLRIPQKKYLAKDFRSSAFKITPYMGHKNCEIGVNKAGDQGMLYYEFLCGEKCGKGEMLIVEKRASKWAIKGRMRVWIS